jgi:hypothetical protein
MTSYFFVMAQLHMAPESAPSVLVATNTTSASAGQQNCGMVRNAKLEETNKVVYAAPRALPFVLTGNSFGNANQPPISKITDAQDVKKAIMVPSHVLAERRIKPLTPYKPVAWSEALSRHGLAWKYPSLVEGIFHGFALGIPSILQTHTPHNHMSITLYHDAYMDNVSKEFQLG